jgi:RNA polymerase sigma factor (sigma-70 family)
MSRPPSTTRPLTAAQQRTVEVNLGLVHAVIRRYRDTPWMQCFPSRQDAIASGVLGLARAVQVHDPARGKLSTLAWWAVLNSLRDEARRWGRGATQPLDPRTAETVPAPQGDTAEDAEHAAALVHKGLAVLNRRARAMVVRVKLRGETLAQTGRRFGVGKQRVFEVVKQSLARMRSELRCHRAAA